MELHASQIVIKWRLVGEVVVEEGKVRHWVVEERKVQAQRE